MHGQMTRSEAPAIDTAQLIATLQSISHGETDAAYLAKRILTSIEAHTLPDDVIESLSHMPAPALRDMLTRMSRSTVYDLPRKLIGSFAQKFAINMRCGRAFQF